MRLFSTDIRIAATLYIVAETEDKARAMAEQVVAGASAQLPVGDPGTNFVVTEEQFSLSMPKISISPAITIHGFFSDGEPFFEEVEGAFER